MGTLGWFWGILGSDLGGHWGGLGVLFFGVVLGWLWTTLEWLEVFLGCDFGMVEVFGG